MNLARYLFNHHADVAAIVTYVMVSIVAGIRAFRGFARGLRGLAEWTAFTWDDGPARRLDAFADRLDRIADRVAEWHSRIAPPNAAPNPTPSLERVEGRPVARSTIGSRGR